MRLTTFTDYALRVLMYAVAAGDRLSTIEETAKVYDVSRTHLMKMVNILCQRRNKIRPMGGVKAGHLWRGDETAGRA